MRRSKLTPERQKRLVEAIREGNYYEAACRYAGITYQTFRNWMERGEKAKSGRYFEFFEAVRQAEAEAERRMVRLWVSQAPENWQAARDFLERRYPERWGRRERHEHTGKDGGPLRQEIALRAETVALLDELARAKANGSRAH